MLKRNGGHAHELHELERTLAVRLCPVLSLDQINVSNVLRLDIARSNDTGDANRSEFV